MKLDVAYLGHSGVEQSGSSAAVQFAPNLRRPEVFFDAELLDPVRFREAVSALHEVVIGDLRFKRGDKAAYLEWKQQEAQREEAIRQQTYERAKADELARISNKPVPPNLERDFGRMHALYWRARRQWANELAKNDPAMFRHLVPCDPIVTVAPDVLLFECFAKDESSYGCLTIDRDAFRGADRAALGTTNVDYSLALFEQFQTLRSYRATRFAVDPRGFEVNVEGTAGYREEKIELPPSWLRGFGQLQAATTLPYYRVTVPVEAVYSILAYLKRHREKSGPRSLRFVLTPGAEHRIVLEPWGVTIACRGTKYQGDRPAEIKVWGRRRLLTLARLLPLADRVEVALLGSGLPSIWCVSMGNMQFTLALSGWTANDWTSGTNVDLLSGTYEAAPHAINSVAAWMQNARGATLPQVIAGTGLQSRDAAGALYALAKRGHAMYDFARDLYRYREAMPFALTADVVGSDSPELAAARELHSSRRVELLRSETINAGRTLYVAKADKTSCEAILDPDGRFVRAKCTCNYFHKYRMRSGPCRHLLALRMQTQETLRDESFARSLMVKI